MNSLEALNYLEDIAYDRKMKYDPHDLKLIVEKTLKALEIIKRHGLSYPHLNLILQSENYGLYRRIIVGSCNNINEFLNRSDVFKYEIPYSREEFELIREVFNRKN